MVNNKFHVSIVLCGFVILLAYPMNGTCQRDSNSFAKERMTWYEEARFGLFIHWGAYSQLDGEYGGKQQTDPKGEWVMRQLKIPVDEYAKEITGTFNPMLFDAEAWVRAARDAGMKYLVVTTKHHDGFALFDSEVSAYNIVDHSPYGKDVIREIANACKKYGLRFGIYYSQAQDWYHPGGLAANQQWDPKQEGDWDMYFKTIAIPQVRELLDNYAPVSLIWFDSKRATGNMALAEAFEKELRNNYPNLILNPRLYKGDFNTYEQVIPGVLEAEYNELCITHNRSWSYRASDTVWKEPEFLLRTFVQMASLGGNYLFNVGPDPNGKFPDESIAALKYFGDWMKINGESVYGTSKSPFYKLDFGTATIREQEGTTHLYLHVFDWPDNGEILIKGLNNHVNSAYLMDGKTKLVAERTIEGTRLKKLPEKPAHKAVTVIVLEIEEPLNINPGYLVFTDNSIVLKPDDALLTIKPQFDHIPFVAGDDDTSYFENWRNRFPHPRFKNTGNLAHWKIVAPVSGDYDAWVKVSTRAATNVVSLRGTNSLKKTLPDTGGMDNFQTVYLGRLKLSKGLQTITFSGGDRLEEWDYVRVGEITLKANQ